MFRRWVFTTSTPLGGSGQQLSAARTQSELTRLFSHRVPIGTTTRRFLSSTTSSSTSVSVVWSCVPLVSAKRWCSTSASTKPENVQWKGSSTSSTANTESGSGDGEKEGRSDDGGKLIYPLKESFKNRSVSRWLLVCAVWISGVILVGAITRLTESGLSITKWKPISGVKPPMTPEEWEAEYDQWLLSVEGQQRGKDMSMDEFKMIFFWEWFHRVLARGIGVVFAGPLIYFAARGHLKKASPSFKLGLGGVAFLGGCQGALGWYMVKSGLDKSLLDAKTKATVSAYRLAAHLSLAFTILSVMVSMAFSLRVPALPKAAMTTMKANTFRRMAYGTTGLMFTTAVSGAFVAGLDAGLLYNDTFPWMGEGIIPPIADLTYIEPLWKNICENPSASQLFHRIMAGTTTCAILALNVAGRRSGLVLTYPHIRKSLKVVNHVLAAQILLGVGALLTYVHTHVAATHQAGAMTLLTSLLYLCALLTSKGRVL